MSLAPGARLLVRDELVLGRHGEPPGSVRQRLRACIDNRPPHDQELRVGPHAPESTGPAVTGGRRAVGSVLLVDAAEAAADAFARAAVDPDVTTARLPIADGGAVLVTALAPDLPSLRHRLATMIDAC